MCANRTPQSMQLSLSFPGERKVPPDQLPDSGPLDGLNSYAESYRRKQILQQPKPQNQKPEGPVAPPFDGESRYHHDYPPKTVKREFPKSGPRGEFEPFDGDSTYRKEFGKKPLPPPDQVPPDNLLRYLEGSGRRCFSLDLVRWSRWPRKVSLRREVCIVLYRSI